MFREKCKYSSSPWFQLPLLLQATNNLCHPHNPQDARNAQSTNISSIHRESHDHVNDGRQSDEEVKCIPSGPKNTSWKCNRTCTICGLVSVLSPQVSVFGPVSGAYKITGCLIICSSRPQSTPIYIHRHLHLQNSKKQIPSGKLT